MHSATNSKLRIIEGNVLALEYLLDWPKDFIIPEMDLTLKQDESAARLRKLVHRTMHAICRVVYQAIAPIKALQAHHHNVSYPKSSSANSCNRIACLYEKIVEEVER